MLQIVIYKKLNFWEEYTPLASMYGLTQYVLTSMTNYHKGSDKSQRLFQISKPADDTAHGTNSPFTSLPLGLGLNKVLITTKSKGS